MSNALPMHPPLATLDDDAWADLLKFIEELRDANFTPPLDRLPAGMRQLAGTTRLRNRTEEQKARG